MFPAEGVKLTSTISMINGVPGPQQALTFTGTYMYPAGTTTTKTINEIASYTAFPQQAPSASGTFADPLNGMLLPVVPAPTTSNSSPAALIGINPDYLLLTSSNPTATLAVGQSAQLTATAEFPGMINLDVTAVTSWESSSPYITVTTKGLIIGVMGPPPPQTEGAGTVTAGYLGVVTSTTFSVCLASACQ